MADLHSDSRKGNSMSTFILAAVVLLSILYLLAKGCTNKDEEKAPATHHSSVNFNVNTYWEENLG